MNVLFANAVDEDSTVLAKGASLEPVIKELTIFRYRPARGITNLNILIGLGTV